MRVRALSNKQVLLTLDLSVFLVIEIGLLLLTLTRGFCYFSTCHRRLILIPKLLFQQQLIHLGLASFLTLTAD